MRQSLFPLIGSRTILIRGWHPYNHRDENCPQDHSFSNWVELVRKAVWAIILITGQQQRKRNGKKTMSLRAHPEEIPTPSLYTADPLPGALYPTGLIARLAPTVPSCLSVQVSPSESPIFPAFLMEIPQPLHAPWWHQRRCKCSTLSCVFGLLRTKF